MQPDDSEDRASPTVRVAMFVLNPCHSDARVRKEAQALGEAGYDVRVFALGNAAWPAALVPEHRFEIQRLEVASVYQRSIRWMGRAYRRELAPRGARSLPWPVRFLLLPFIVILGAARAASDLVRASWRRLSRWVRQLERVSTDAMDQRVGALTNGWSRQHWVVRRAGEFARRPVRRVLVALRRVGRTVRRAVQAAAGSLRRTFRAERRVIGRKFRAGRRALRRKFRAGRRVLRRTFRAAARFRRRSLRAIYLFTVRIVRTRLLVLHRPSVYLEFWRSAGDAAAAWEPDVVHAHDLNALPAAMRAAKRTDAVVVYDSHELWRHRNRVTGFHPVGRTFDALQERRLIRRADLVITVGDRIEDWLRRTYGLPHHRTAVVRNVPMSRKAEVPAPSLRRLAGLPHERILLYTGRVTSGRGIEEAIDALPQLPADLHLVLLGYGDSHYLADLRSRSDAAGVQARVHLVAAVPSEQVPAVASQADLALVAVRPLCLSYRYALPNKLFEAIQAGLPVVASDLPEIGDIVRRYGVGRLFEIGDPRGLADAVQHVLDEPDSYRRATIPAAAELCWERERTVLLEAYRRLAPMPAPDAPSTDVSWAS